MAAGRFALMVTRRVSYDRPQELWSTNISHNIFADKYGGFYASVAKFFSICRPTAWLFSGWNCVAKRLSRQIIAVNGSW